MSDNPSNAPEGLEQNQPFDPEKALAELASGQEETATRKLSFHDQCAALALVKSHVKRSVIAKTFAVTPETISHIAGCGANRRYQRVAREWNELGQRAFDRKYFTQDLHLRVAQIKYDVDNQPDRRGRLRPSLSADKKGYRAIGVFPINDEFWRVDWMRFRDAPEKDGWYFSYCKPDGSVVDGETKLRAYGAEEPEQPRIPYRTSGYAYNAAFAFCHTSPPRS